MSAQEQIKRLTAPDTRAAQGGEAIVALSSYHAHTARILDQHCDVILVGDSLGMVMHGLESTVPVTLEMMVLQGHAVMRGSRRALVVVDMPFGSYEASREQAFMSAARILKETGCGAIKVEGGRRMAETIAFLVERGVPVMGHVGLTPQAINTIGSFRAQGRDESDWAPIEADAPAVADAGPFGVVLEAIAEPLARRIAGAVAIPTIGIGASVACDGQILVLEDMLGLSPRVPKFVKRFGELGPSIEQAVKGYAEEVRARTFPGPDNVYGIGKWERYGRFAIAGCILIVVAVGGWRGYDWWQAKKAAESGAAFEAAVALAETGNHQEAEAAFAKLATDGTASYRTLA